MGCVGLWVGSGQIAGKSAGVSQVLITVANNNPSNLNPSLTNPTYLLPYTYFLSSVALCQLDTDVL